MNFLKTVGQFFSVFARDDLRRFQRSAILDHCRVTSSFGPGSFFIFSIGSDSKWCRRMRYGADFDEYILKPKLPCGCSAVEGD